MTETEMKLRDAATQMKMALANVADEEIVRSCVNSYISHARSVTFVMQRESSQYPELSSWYEAQMAALKKMPLLQFFNAQRIYSIHKGVIAPKTETAPIEGLRVNGVPTSGQASMTFLRFEGADQFFPGRSGGVFRLCEEYFVVLKSLVGEWLRKKNELGL